MRMAQLARIVLMPHSKQAIDASDFLLFPDDMNELPEDVDAQERAWMAKLNRMGG